MDKLTELINKWAYDRGLQTMDPTKQMLKLIEEVGELASAIAKNKKAEIIDSVGDIYVVLVILATQLKLNLTECVASAYEEIKDRKGKVVNGIFIKEEDMNEKIKKMFEEEGK